MKINFETMMVNLAILSVSVLLLNGCNTVQGMGKDITKGGQAIENAAGNGSTSKKSTTYRTQTTTPTSTQTTTQTTTTKTTAQPIAQPIYTNTSGVTTGY